jgi:hypothetical protein
LAPLFFLEQIIITIITMMIKTPAETPMVIQVAVVVVIKN